MTEKEIPCFTLCHPPSPASPFVFTLCLHPLSSPISCFTLCLHPLSSPFVFTLCLHPVCLWAAPGEVPGAVAGGQRGRTRHGVLPLLRCVLGGRIFFAPHLTLPPPPPPPPPPSPSFPLLPLLPLCPLCTVELLRIHPLSFLNPSPSPPHRCPEVSFGAAASEFVGAVRALPSPVSVAHLYRALIQVQVRADTLTQHLHHPLH